MPSLPGRMRLPVLFWVYTRLEVPEPELRHIAKLVGRHGGLAIDAGANAGLYSYALSRVCAKVHAFEILPQHCRSLEQFDAPNIQIHTIGLSNRHGEATVFTPVHPSGAVLMGWASLEKGNCPNAEQHLEEVVRVRPLDSFEFENCAFLKIDVEGHELEVLEGAAKTISRTRPRILVEVRKKNEASVEAFLRNLGFRQRDFGEVLGYAGGEGNRLYMPE